MKTWRWIILLTWICWFLGKAEGLTAKEQSSLAGLVRFENPHTNTHTPIHTRTRTHECHLCEDEEGSSPFQRGVFLSAGIMKAAVLFAVQSVERKLSGLPPAASQRKVLERSGTESSCHTVSPL